MNFQPAPFSSSRSDSGRNSLVAVIAGVLLLIIAGGALWLSNAHIMPPTQKMELAVPDERIPH